MMVMLGVVWWWCGVVVIVWGMFCGDDGVG